MNNYFESLEIKPLIEDLKQFENNDEVKKEILEHSQDLPCFLLNLCVEIYGRCEIFEEVISKNLQASYWYATDVIKGRLPETMHNKMLARLISDPYNYNAKNYFDFLKKKGIF